MRLTTKGRYAVTAVLDMALHQNQGPVSLALISERQGISLSYLEQLFAKLRRQKIVNSTRGPGGGYTLASDTDNVSVSQIINAVDETCQVVDCNDSEGCGNDYHCLTHDLWQELSQEIHNFLDNISLSEIMAFQVDKSDKDLTDNNNIDAKQASN